MRNKGITLVALVITIIILIILASVTFSMVLGQNGLIEKSKDGADRYKEEATREQNEINNVTAFIDSIVSGSGTTPSSNPVSPVVTFEEGKSDSMLTKTTNSTYTDTTRESNNVVTIPAGYKISSDSATKIEDGIVIQDASGNQWVWIPVDEAMADTIEEAELGGIGKSGVTTTLQSKSELISGKTRGNVGATSGYKEPDIIKEYDKTANASTYLADAGFTNEETALYDFATDLSTSYKNMIESVEELGGFYIGRYEITGTLANPTEKPGWAITGDTGSTGEQGADWYKLYSSCKKFTTSSATSRMIWSCTWDETCKFIENKGYNLSNSNTYGNYSDSTVTSSDGTSILKGNGVGMKLQSGITTFTKTCNIYDLAGNCEEYTQEASGYKERSLRGCFRLWEGKDHPVIYRRSWNPVESSNNWTSRPILYINKQ